MTDAEARKAMRKNVLRGGPAILLAGLAVAGVLYAAHRLPGVWNFAAFFSFALSGLCAYVALFLAMPRFRDAFRWPPSTMPQLMFPRIARARPLVRAGVAFLAVGAVLLVFGLVH